MNRAESAAAIHAALARAAAGLDGSYKATSLGMWACSDTGEVAKLFEQIGLEDYQHLADIGSGDGRVVLVASLFTRATGIEVDPELIDLGRQVARELNLSRAGFLKGDARQADLSPYDLLYIYPDKPLDWLEDLLPAGWRGRLLVYGPYFKPGRMKFLGSYYAGSTHCTLWEKGAG